MSSQPLYPYVLAPKEVPAIWGGESWKCWDENRVRNGPLAGESVADLRARLGAELLGPIDPARRFPILTKIITANDSLSVQVHPDDAYAQRVEHQPNGKTECWYIMDARPGAELVLGWTRDTSRAEYERRVADGSLGDILRRVPVKPGEAYYLPAGTLHAIGAGIVIFETQQASDLTYRIFDWNRVGADGKPRQLHVEKAADVLDYHAGTRVAVETIEYTFDALARTLLIADAHFVVERVTATSEPATIATGDRPVAVMALDAGLSVSCDGGDAVLAAYDNVLVPAAAERFTVCAAADSAAFVLVTPPPGKNGVAAQLIAAGVEQSRIDGFLEQF